YQGHHSDPADLSRGRSHGAELPARSCRSYDVRDRARPDLSDRPGTAESTAAPFREQRIMTDKAQSLGDFTLTRRKVLLGLGMVAASGTAMARMPEPNTAPIDTDLFNSLIPNEVGPWRFASRSGV